MGIKITGNVGVSHSYTGNNGDFEYDIEYLGMSEEDFLALTDQQREDFLDMVLDTEISNVLDCGIGWEKV